MRRRFFPFALLLGFLAVEAPLFDALAQPAQPAQPAPSSTASASPAPAQDDADRLFREGNELYKQKRFADAEALFEKAFAKKPAHDIAANLGYVELYQNKLVEAAEHLAYAVRIWPPTGKDDKRQGATERLAKVKAEIATLTIEVNVAGAHVTIGEREVGTSPLAGEVFADAGRVVVRVKREGYVDAERAIDVAKGSAQTVSVVLEAVPASAPTATATASASATATPPRSYLPSAIAFGVGGAGLIAGIIAGALTIAKTNDLGTTCDASNRCPTRLRGDWNDANTAANVANVAFVIASVGAAVGTTLLFVPRSTTPSMAGLVIGPTFVGVKGAF